MSSSSSCKISVAARIAVIGVLSSWVTVSRNSSFGGLLISSLLAFLIDLKFSLTHSKYRLVFVDDNVFLTLEF
jgi:hypothetical protein